MHHLKIFIIAGEESGDLLGSQLMQELKKLAGLAKRSEAVEVEFTGIGGKRMMREGLLPLFPMEKIAVMGIAEILPRLPMLWYLIRYTAQTIYQEHPDIVITIDAPDFCTRVMQRLAKLDREHSIKRYHVVAPSVWVYRERRAAKMAQLYDLLFALLPFEPKYFEKYGLETVFIGHPLVASQYNRLKSVRGLEDVQRERKQLMQFAAKYEPVSTATTEIEKFIRETKIFCITPGSRSSEIRRMLPIFLEVLNRVRSQFALQVFLLATPDSVQLIQHQLAKTATALPITIITDPEDKEIAMSIANLALAKSGTNTFEFMLKQVPLIIVYKFNALTTWIARKIFKIINQYANLVNVVAKKEVIPEFTNEKCIVADIADKTIELLNSPLQLHKQVVNYSGYLTEFVADSSMLPMEIAARKIWSTYLEQQLWERHVVTADPVA